MALRIAGFGSYECTWIPSEALGRVFYHVFIWHLTGEEDSCSENELSSTIVCQIKAQIKTQLNLYES